MAKIFVAKETDPGEARVALTPDSALRLRKLGHSCLIESGAGEAAGFDDESYCRSGVRILPDAEAGRSEADVIIQVRPPSLPAAESLRSGQTLISFFWPAQSRELLSAANRAGATVFAMDMVPRISRAQKMDALSSMANIAGYRAVLEAGNSFGRFFTGQVTAAGKIPPAKLLVIGAGVAGLSAIGAAVSLGAIVRAFDVRPEVAEQIESMGAEFLLLDFDEDASGDGGYAKPSSPEFRDKQLELFHTLAPEIDIVITTALIPGIDAPKLWLEDMVRVMKPGSVIVDLAAERGGNCELTVVDEKIRTGNGVTIIGYTDFPSRMPEQASLLYSTNIFHLLSDLTPARDGNLVVDPQDDVIRGTLVAHKGEVTYPPPPPKTPAVTAPAKRRQAKPLSPEEKQAAELAEYHARTRKQAAILVAGASVTIMLGIFAPASFMQHFIVFVLGCFVGFQVIWNVTHALHTPLMSVTNAISGIIIVGALLQIGSGNIIVLTLAAVSVLIASINIVGGFLVTHRMLAMFRRS
ncbi:MAG: Re/Si-specific NAD(P)(+) transhydrogenase subunit alpha [Rhodobacteraceae bacterium]|nr:Re/Si-specific NAD(P)(+) transhydrogenase subunit alpha [Paracoccaceae bacterium]